ncbi:MAG TPA: hypothetical protein VM122_03635 [Usitatibacter sp.]|nr:hypothetical protein [Usitatibacter sp.]
MPLDLVIPDLLLPVDAPEALRSQRLPALESWLARGVSRRLPHRGLEAALSATFALGAPIPIAAVTLAADDAPRAGAWLRADPVHLRVGQDAVALHDAGILGVMRDEANALVAALQALFADDGLEFVAPTPHRWYVRVPDGELPRTVPLPEALGRNVFRLLPVGSGRINWPSAITEVQMLFSQHAVNQAREAEGRPAINSVWFWGEGQLPESIDSPYALVCADEPFAAGLGRLSGVRTVAAPRDFASIDAVGVDESVLVVLDGLGAALRRGDDEAWRKAAQALEETWFAEIDRAIRRFERVSLVLPGPRDTLVATLTAGTRWRWFRSRKPIATHA